MKAAIRRVGHADLEAISVLFDAYRQFYGRDSDLAGAREFLEARMNNNESIIFMASNDDGAAVGFTQLYPIFSSVGMRRVWLLNDLFVAESARRSGVASQLIDATRELARSTDAAGLLLETQVENHRAQQLYEKIGFVRNEATWFYYLAV